MRAIVAVLLLVSAVTAAMWRVLRDRPDAPDVKGTLPSGSYAPCEGTGPPDVDNTPNAEKIRADMKPLARLTRAIRLYSWPGGVELVPPIANEFGIKVMVGAWIDKDRDRNEREIAAAIDLAKHNSNVIGIVVGNETVYRGEQKVEDLIELIKRVKTVVDGRVPVTTGEIWIIWRDNPELGYSVDFIAAHVLPYWEYFTDKQAVDQAFSIYGLLGKQFQGKRIVIAEFGWPSAGYNLKGAEPGTFEQAVVLRNFVTRAEAIQIEYNIVEAIDQPWEFFEAGVGPYCRTEETAGVPVAGSRHRWSTKRRPAAVTGSEALPKVSIHIPAYYEPPDMLKQTLDAVSRLDYPNFECVVIINNTPDPDFWQPIQDHCRALGDRFKFIIAEKVQVFKADASRIAMRRTPVTASPLRII